MRVRFVSSVLSLPVWIGCAASAPEVTYTPPEEHLVTIIGHVEEPFETVWDRLAIGLPRMGLSIENEIEADGRITAFLATDGSHEYVDCGDIVYGTGKKFEVARTTRRTTRSSSQARQTFLEGRVYITVERQGALTLVSLRPVYDLSVDARSTNYHWREKWVRTPTIKDSEGNVLSGGETTLRRTPGRTTGSSETRAITFVTNSPNQANWGTGDEPLYVNCCSTGRLEEQILALAQGGDD